MARKRKRRRNHKTTGGWSLGGRYVIGYDDKGYLKTKNVLAKTKRECAEKLQRLKEELGGIKSDKVKPDMRFGDWLEYWYETHSKPKIRATTQ